ncbi:hypothetical protein NXX35_17005 [Bacteroides xylanisolvens]|nr:hypothetical protein NXX35_17005 [Bacteroides xylanisolvens]
MKPNGVRAEECGKSERHPVTGRIEVETSPHTKVGRLPHGGCFTRNLWNL